MPIKVVAEKTIKPATATTHLEDWLYFGREFDVLHRRFAFFVERKTHTYNCFTMVTGAGVYWGREGEVPELADTQISGESGFFQVDNYTIQGNSVSFTVPDIPTRYAPHKHYLYAVVDANGAVVPESFGMKFDVQPDKSVTCVSQHDLPAGVKLEAYYGPCLSINFYDVAA